MTDWITTSISGAFWGLIASVPWWAWWGLAILPLLVNLTLLARIHQLFGWKAVAAVLLVEWTLLVYIFAYVRGRQGEALNPLHSSHQPPPSSGTRGNVAGQISALPSLGDLFGKSSQRRRFNFDTNMWEPVNGQ